MAIRINIAILFFCEEFLTHLQVLFLKFVGCNLKVCIVAMFVISVLETIFYTEYADVCIVCLHTKVYRFTYNGSLLSSNQSIKNISRGFFIVVLR
jgi:hypothetical protein